MKVIAIGRIIAIFSSGLLAGILFGDRLSATFAQPSLSPPSFVQFQQIQHAHFARMLLPLTLGAKAGRLVWLMVVRAREPFSIVAGSRCNRSNDCRRLQSRLRLGCVFCRTFPYFADLTPLSSFAATSEGELLISGLQVRVLPGSPLISYEPKWFCPFLEIAPRE